MRGFIEGENRYQATMFPERLDDYITKDNSVRVVDVFIDSLDLVVTGITSGAPDPKLLVRPLQQDFEQWMLTHLR